MIRLTVPSIEEDDLQAVREVISCSSYPGGAFSGGQSLYGLEIITAGQDGRLPARLRRLRLEGREQALRRRPRHGAR